MMGLGAVLWRIELRGRCRVVTLPFPFPGVVMAVVEALGGKGVGEGWRGARVQSRLGGYILA